MKNLGINFKRIIVGWESCSKLRLVGSILTLVLNLIMLNRSFFVCVLFVFSVLPAVHLVVDFSSIVVLCEVHFLFKQLDIDLVTCQLPCFRWIGCVNELGGIN